MRSSALRLPALTLLAGLLVGLGGRAAGAEEERLERAQERLDVLSHLLDRRSSSNADLLAALDELASSYAELRSDEDAPDGSTEPSRSLSRLLERSEKAFVEALALSQVQRGSRDNPRHEIQIRAAEILGAARPEAAERVMRTLEREVFKDSDYDRSAAFYERVFRSLVRLGDPSTFTWLLEEALNSDVNPESERLALAALRAMMSIRDVTGDERREAVRRILAIFQSYSFHWVDDYEVLSGWRSTHRHLKKISGTASPYFMDVRPTVLAALTQFTTDPRTGVPALDDDTGTVPETIPRFMVWFGKHKRGGPPWVDGLPEPVDRPGARAAGRYQAPGLTEIWRKYGIPWEQWWYDERDLNVRPVPRLTDEEGRPAAFLTKLRQEILPPLLAEARASPDSVVRAVACVIDGKLGGPGKSELLQGMFADDLSERVREAAVLGMLLLQDPELVPLFRHLVEAEEENPRVRGAAVLALGFLSDRAWLNERLGPEGEHVSGSRETVADLHACGVRALSFEDDPTCSDALVDLMRRESASDEARGHAGTALLRVGTPEVLPRVLHLLKDTRNREEKHVAQVAAALALPKLIAPDDERSLRRIQERLRDAKGRFGGIRNLLAISLGRIGGEEARRILEEAYDECVDDTMRFAERGYFLLGMAYLGTSESRAALRARFEALDHERDMAAGAIALAIAGDRLAVRPILDRLPESEREFAPHGMVALALLGETEAVDAIEEVLARRSEPEVIREGALALAMLLGENGLPQLLALWARAANGDDYDALAWALRWAAGPSTIEALVAIHRDETRPPLERAYALAALGRIGDPAEVPILCRFASDFHPYAGAPTLLGLARYRDVPFLH